MEPDLLFGSTVRSFIYTDNERKSLDSLSTSDKESYEEYFDSRFPRWLAPLLLIVGVLGNILCLLIFSQKQMRKNSTFIYLAFLSIVDLFVLALGLGDIVLISYFKFILRNSSSIVCRLHSFLTYLFTHLSSFLLAAVSVDRAIATNLITFSKIYCKPIVAYKIILVNIILAVVINFHSLIFLGYYSSEDMDESSPNKQANSSSSPPINTNTDYYVNIISNKTSSSSLMGVLEKQFTCGSEKGTLYDYFLDPYFKWIDLFSYAIIPFFTMAICTFLIVRVLFLSNKRLNKKKKPNAGSKAPPAAKNNDNSAGSDVAKALIASKQQQQPKKPKANKAKHLTYTLIALNCLFFALVSPLVIVLIFVDVSQASHKILINIVYLLAYSNHSINFILYWISSPPFRESLIKIYMRVKQLF